MGQDERFRPGFLLAYHGRERAGNSGMGSLTNPYALPDAREHSMKQHSRCMAFDGVTSCYLLMPPANKRHPWALFSDVPRFQSCVSPDHALPITWHTISAGSTQSSLLPSASEAFKNQTHLFLPLKAQLCQWFSCKRAEGMFGDQLCVQGGCSHPGTASQASCPCWVLPPIGPPHWTPLPKACHFQQLCDNLSLGFNLLMPCQKPAHTSLFLCHVIRQYFIRQLQCTCNLWQLRSRPNYIYSSTTFLYYCVFFHVLCVFPEKTILSRQTILIVIKE